MSFQTKENLEILGAIVLFILAQFQAISNKVLLPLLALLLFYKFSTLSLGGKVAGVCAAVAFVLFRYELADCFLIASSVLILFRIFRPTAGSAVPRRPPSPRVTRTVPSSVDSSVQHHSAIPDQFSTLQEVTRGLMEAGLEGSSLIIGIDFTKSNEFTGEHSFHGKNLHSVQWNQSNPYEKVVSVIGTTLESFDDDGKIPAYSFGDVQTTDKSVLPFFPDRYCNGFREVLTRYRHLATELKLSGPTNFAPLIYEAIEIVKQMKSYHILIIIADGQVIKQAETRQAIVDASHYALSIIMVGVGDGPFDLMEEFDDQITDSKFDNFQFVNATKIFPDWNAPTTEEQEAKFATQCLMELPSQYREICRLGLLP